MQMLQRAWKSAGHGHCSAMYDDRTTITLVDNNKSPSGHLVVVWRSFGALASINEVNQRRARLVLRWVTVSGFNSR